MQRNPQREAELIDKIANFMLDYGVDSFFEPMLETFQPFGDVLGFMLFLGVFPFFEVIGGYWHDFNNILIEDPKSNIDKLTTRIQEIREARAEEERNKPPQTKNRKRSLGQRIKGMFRR
jgi:hypothetical protein